jgi:hypothetical protein
VCVVQVQDPGHVHVGPNPEANIFLGKHHENTTRWGWIYATDLPTESPRLSHTLSKPSHQMASVANPHPPRRRAHDLTASSSLRGSYPGTPRHEDDEQAPLLRPSDIDSAAYSGTRRS